MKALLAASLLLPALLITQACRTGGSEGALKSDDSSAFGKDRQRRVVLGVIRHRKTTRDYVSRQTGGELGLSYANADVQRAADAVVGVAHIEGQRTDGSTFKVLAVRPASFPNEIACRVTGGKDENGKPVQPSSEFKLKITGIHDPKGPFKGGEDGLIMDEEMGGPKDEVTFDFGVGAHGGDQYSAFHFDVGSVEALGSGAAPTIKGTYESGFDFSDGEHIGLYDVECQGSGKPTAAPDAGSLGAYRLVQPGKIAINEDGTAAVTYRAPCAEHDFEGFVGHARGQKVFVGVAYPVQYCKPGPVQDIEAVLISGDASGHVFGGDAKFEPISLGGGAYLAAPVELKSQGEDLIAKFKAPCDTVAGEAFVQAIDDSGNREMAVGVVFAKSDCKGQGPTEITRTIKSDDPAFAYLGGGEGDDITYVPMPLTIVEP